MPPRRFLRKADAGSLAIETERRIDRGGDLTRVRPRDASTFGDLVDIHIEDMKEAGKPIGRSKDFSLQRRRQGGPAGYERAAPAPRAAACESVPSA